MPVPPHPLVTPHPPHAVDAAVERRRARGLRGWTPFAVVALLALLLLPVALFPLGGDAALYYVSGQKILHEGAVHYRDIVDVKPPLIYHLYAAAAALFGSTPVSFRILDYLLQLVTTLGLGALVARRLGRPAGAIAAITYAIGYVALSYNSTAITESYVGLLAVPMLALQLRRRGARDMLLVGALGGLLFLLKFSLVTPLAAAMLAELVVVDDRIGARLRRIALMGAGFVAVAALLPLYLTLAGAWHGFAEMNAFLAGYVKHSSQGLVGSAREALTRVPEYFASDYSLTLLAATMIGVMLSLRSTDETDAPGSGGRALLRIAVLDMVLATLAVVIEAKYRVFHFARLLPFAAIVASAGFVWIARALRSQPPRDRFGRVAIALLVVAALALSPLARYVRHGAAAAMWIVSGDAGFDRAFSGTDLGYSYAELRRIGDTVRTDCRPGDELFVSSSVAAMVHVFSGTLPPTPIYHSAFLIAPYAPQVWRDRTRYYLLARRPRFIVLHPVDSMAEMTGVQTTSAAALRALPSVDSLIDAAYDTAVTTEHFVLYERRRR